MQTLGRFSIVRTAPPVLTDACIGIGVAVLVLAASWTGTGPQWIVNPRPLDAVAIGLLGVVAGGLALRQRYPISVLVVLNAVTLAWSAAEYPGRLIIVALLLGCYTRRSSFAFTSNRGVDEWLGLFDDPILGNSALDRLANAAHQVVIEGSSYRAKLAPKRREVVAA